MYRSLLSVGGFTLLSRATGFLRDIVLGAILGVGVLSDAFFVAFRLPNHFRTIFGEVAFNSAYVPCYAQVLETRGNEEAHRFSNQIFTYLLASQIVLLALAWIFMPAMVDLLGARLPGESRKIRAHGDDDADHLSLSALHHDRHAAIGHAECQRPLRRRSLRAGAAQRDDDRLSRASRAVSECRDRCQLGHDGFRFPADADDRLRRPTRRDPGDADPARNDRRGETLLRPAGARRDRLRRPADRGLCRHDHRVASAHGKPHRALLRRPDVPAAAGRHRHRGRHRCSCRR